MRSTLALLLLLTNCAHTSTKLTHEGELFVSRDFTAPRFTTNIEGPEVDEKGRLFVTNFEEDGTIALVNDRGACERFLTLPKGSAASSIRFDSKRRMLVADYQGHNIFVVDVTTRVVSVLARASFNQPNDMAITKNDVLFVSDPNFDEKTGQLWRVDNGVATRLETMGTTNGIELSPDERTLYVNESEQRRIWAFDVTSSGVTRKRLFAEFSDHGLDGMKCDRAGNLYVTRYGKGAIAVLGPSGKLLREIVLRSKEPSNLVFGGRDGRTVFVTTQDRKLIETFRVAIPGRRFR